ncbi:hypothetical protein [Candidatus Contendibacter odensensis]|uniref:Uncharacterized protein n=1 Tax=Candidatus Contendobacter odensis Run_B_J11 TaxID=1400861 RepID=A0A7U7G8H5_9GAMM|nr:hypothetical protein [Candidatus Contendobacter odensis]CDH43808.1 hypothetical protein BN874_1350006 [Candidatus Contendobacter odensis Run_B_J11]
MTCCEKCDRSPECVIPDWAQLVKPHELAFYHHHLKSLSQSFYGISAIVRTLHNMTIDSACDPSAPDWWNENLSGGLLTAIEKLADGASHPLEFMLTRATEFAPKDDKAQTTKASP